MLRVLSEVLFPYVVFAGTYAYIRMLAAVIRALLPSSFGEKLESIYLVLAFILPSTLLGLLVLIVLFHNGSVWISPVAIIISLTQDALYLIGAIYYHLTLARIRSNPGSFQRLIRKEEYSRWPSVEMVRFPLGHVLELLPVFRRQRDYVFLVRNIDFTRSLKNDSRKIDQIVVGEDHRIESRFLQAPHLKIVRKGEELISNNKGCIRGLVFGNLLSFAPKSSERKAVITEIKATKGFDNETEGDSFIKEDIATVTLQDVATDVGDELDRYMMNRYINSQLSDEEWRTSEYLCTALPSLVAKSWREFHFQNTTRTRFVSLFNTNELIIRLLAALVKNTLERNRDVNFLLPELRQRRLFRDESKLSFKWLNLMNTYLNESSIASLEGQRLRNLMLSESLNQQEWERRLAPFEMALGNRLSKWKGPFNMLASLQMTTILRNKLVGHGGMGSLIDLQQSLFLSAIHSFFLYSLADLKQLDIKVMKGGESDEAFTRLDAGLNDDEEIVPENEEAYISFDGASAPVSLFPFVRYHQGRLVFYDDMVDDEAHYVDFNASSTIEPSIVTLECKRHEVVRQ